ncbi:unnamed protein product [Cuscuta campestris]|uniref:Uncharacterized protein n=1 Tax=Cuscuta campestris TaxID=132261 RepID=A0A484KTU3_9ASTE|nr:unnamed protein product [Cuscuta campestris]
MRDGGRTSEIVTCEKHPSASSVGICSRCLKDRLLELVCSDCGENRVSSCSFSDVSSSRISFLIENERGFDQLKAAAAAAGRGLRRSSSNREEIKKSGNGFWKIKSLFGKIKNRGIDDHQVFDEMRVSRSRSLCSFRDDGSDQFRFSGAKISDATAWSMPGSDYPRNGEDSATWVDTKPRISSDRHLSWSGRGIMRLGSCRVTANGGEESEKGRKRGRKRYRVWKWMTWQK